MVYIQSLALQICFRKQRVNIVLGVTVSHLALYQKVGQHSAACFVLGL